MSKINNKSIILLFVMLLIISVGGVHAAGDVNETSTSNAEDTMLTDTMYIENDDSCNLSLQSSLENQDSNCDVLTSDEVYTVNDPIVNPSFEVNKISGWDCVNVSTVNSKLYAQNGSYFVSLTNKGSYISQIVNFNTIDSISFWYMSPTVNSTVGIYLDDINILNYTIQKTGYAKNRWEEVNIDTSTITGYHKLKLLQNEDKSYIDNFNVNYNSNVFANFTIDSFCIVDDEITINFREKSYGLITGYLWDFGDGITTNNQNSTHKFKLGQYTITLTVSNSYSTDSCSYILPIHSPTIERTGSEYSTIQNAIDNAENGDVITITPNMFIDSYFENLVVDKDLTLNFNGCKLFNEDSIPIVQVKDGAKLTINNISLQSNNLITTDSSSNLIIENSEIDNANITLNGNVVIKNNCLFDGFLTILTQNVIVEYCNFTNYGIVVNGGKSRFSNNIISLADIGFCQYGGELNLTSNSIYDNGIGVNVSSGVSIINFNEIYSNDKFGLVYSNDNIDYLNNWWGSNNPTFNSSLNTPNEYFDIYKVSEDNLFLPSYLVLNISKHDLDYHYWIGGVTYYNLTIDLCHNNLGEDISNLGSLPSKNYNFKFNNVSFDVNIENGFNNYLFTWGYLSHMDDEIITYYNSYYSYVNKRGYIISEMDIQFANETITLPLEVDTTIPNITYITPHTIFDEYLEIKIECDDPTAVIFYTLDGTNPRDSPSRMVYTAPFIIDESTTVHATAIDFIGHYARINYTWVGRTNDDSTSPVTTKYYDYAITYLMKSELVESDGIWNKYNDNNGVSNQTGPLNNITKWSITDFVSTGSPVIDKEGHIYIGGDDGYLYCLNSQGLVIWRYGTYSKISSTPTIGADGNIYFVNYYNCSVYCLSPDGQLLWKYYLGEYNTESSPVFGNDGTLHVLTNNGTNSNLFAFRNWKLIWNCSLPIISGSTPAVGSDGTIYLLTENHCVVAINWDGAIKYNYCLVEDYINIEGRYSELEMDFVDYYASHVSVTIGEDGSLYVINQPNYIYRDKLYFTAPFIRSYNPDGNLNWYYQKLPRILEPGESVDLSNYPDVYVYTICSGAPTLYKGVLYIHEQSRLSAVNSSNGKVLWNASLIDAPYSASSPLVSGDEIIYLSHGNMVHAFNLNGTQLWSYSIPGLYGGALSLSSPVLTDDGTLIVTTNQGIYAFNDIAVDFRYEHVEGTERTIQFTDLSTKGNNIYFWSFGDGYYSQEQNPQHMYAEPGKYRIELVVEHDGINLARNTTIEVISYDITPPAPVTAYINGAKTSGGTFPQTQTVSLSSSDDSNQFTIYYTVDGSNPVDSPTRRVYMEPFDIESYTVLNMVAVDSSNNTGKVTTLTFNITDAINVNDRINSTLIQKIQELLDNAEPNSKFVFDYSELYGANFTINKPLNIITTTNTRLIGNGYQPVFTLGENAAGSTINGFTIENNNANGILIINTENINVINSNIKAGNAISIQNSKNTLVKDTSIVNSTNGVQVVYSDNTNINRVSIVNSTQNGVYLKSSTNNVIQNSYFEINGIDPYYSEANHILLDSNDNTKIINNVLNYGYFGLYFRNTNKNTLVDNNTIYEGIGDAIYLSGRYLGLDITHNTLDGCFMGINFNGYSENVEVTNNLIQKMHSHDGEPQSGREYDLFYNFSHTSDLYGQYNNAIQVFELASNFHGEVHIENNVCILLEHRAWEARKTGTYTQTGCNGYGYNLMDGSDSYHWLTTGTTHYKEGFVNLVLDRIGDSSYRLRLQNMRTGEFLSDIPAFDVIFTAGRYTQTVKFIDNQAIATFDVAASITTITAKISAEIKKSISWNTPIAEGYSSSNKEKDSGYEAGEAINNPNPKAPSIADMINRFSNKGNGNGNGDGNGQGHGNGIGNGNGNGVGDGGSYGTHGGASKGIEGDVNGRASDLAKSSIGNAPLVGSPEAQTGSDTNAEGGSDSGESPVENPTAYEVTKKADLNNNIDLIRILVVILAIFFFIIGWRRRGDEDDEDI